MRYLLILLLTGCATQPTTPIADSGSVRITWEIGYVPPQYGCGYAREVARGHWLVTFRRKYGWHELCWPHELNHAFGAEHD